MKILCVIDSLGAGGAQRQIVQLAIGFKKRGHEVSFLTHHLLEFFKPQLEENSIPIKTIVEPNYFKRLFRIRKEVRNHNADVVLSFLEATNFMVTLAGIPAKPWKLVVGERNAKPQILKSLKLILFRNFHIFADKVIANSFHNVHLIRKVNPFTHSNKFKVIYNGLDLNEWQPRVSPEQISSSKKIMVASRHRKHKNLLGLVEAVNLLSKQEQEQLIIEWYGSKRDESFNEGLVKIKQYNLEHVFHFFDNTPNVLEKMQNADAIGLFSLYEGLPNSICEGMAVGKPIISTDVSDAKNLVTPQNGFLCDATSEKSIAYAISQFLRTDSNTLNKMGVKSRKIAEKLFDREKVINDYLEVFKKLK
ncbi:MAG: glycosyltransferase [Moheibacter sp.]